MFVLEMHEAVEELNPLIPCVLSSMPEAFYDKYGLGKKNENCMLMIKCNLKSWDHYEALTWCELPNCGNSLHCIEIRVPKNKVFKSFTARQQLTVSFSNKKLKND